MNPQAYFADLSAQLRSIQNRVRHLIGDAHWPSDGAWKESALRSVIRGYLPGSMSVGTGFILTAEGPSSQIDVLIYDDSAPLLFRDGDFVVATADSVRAVIEVKTSVTRAPLKVALEKLSAISHHLRQHAVHRRPFIGLFAYEATGCAPEEVLNLLKETNGRVGDYEISALCFGERQFYRYWEFDPDIPDMRFHESWHAYDMPQLAPGYFIHNVVEHLYPHAVARSQPLWYPIDGKEARRVGQKKRKDATLMPETNGTQ